MVAEGISWTPAAKEQRGLPFLSQALERHVIGRRGSLEGSPRNRAGRH